MSLLGLPFVGGLLVTLLQVHDAHAQGTNATCVPGFNWMTNSKEQSPCLMAAWLSSACLADPTYAYVYSLPEDYHYRSPTVESATPCSCSMVFYSMIGACAACQQRSNLPWSSWSWNCTKVSSGGFPKTIPGGTSIPAWAYLNVTDGDAFNVTAAHAVAQEHLLESTGAPAPTGASITSTSASSQSSPAAGAPSVTLPAPVSGGGNGSDDSTSSSKKSDVGPIVGGVVGGVAAIAIIAGLIAWLMTCNKRKPITSSLMGQSAMGSAQGTYHEKSMDPSMGIPSPTLSSPPILTYQPGDPSHLHAQQMPYMGAPTLPPSYGGVSQQQPYQPGRYTDLLSGRP